MVKYESSHRSLSLMVGLIVFVFALMITLADVHGMDRFDFRSPGSGQGGGQAAPNAPSGCQNQNSDFDDGDPILTPTPPTTACPSVPEPATLTLLGMGAGVLFLRRRKR